MKPKLFLCLVLIGSSSLFGYCNIARCADEAVSNSASSTNIQPSLESLLNAAFPDQKAESTGTGSPAVKSQPLTAAQRNQIAVTAVGSLWLRTTNERLRDTENPRLIAPLINILDDPDVPTYVRDQAAQVLCRLTRREYTELYQYSDGEKHAQFVRWWRDWWEKNKDKHPVFDDELKRVITARVTAIRNQIFLEVNGYGGFASGSIPAVSINRSDRDTVMAVTMDSSMLATASPRSGGQIYLLISAHFETPRFQLNPIASRNYPAGTVGEWQPLGHKEKINVKEVYRESLPGTDIAITVDAASQDGVFPRLVRECLQKPPESIQPEIARLTEQIKDETNSAHAAFMLVRVGEYAPVIAALSNTNLTIQRGAVIGLASGPFPDTVNGKAAGPLLVHLLKTNDAYTRYLAAWALGHVHEEDKATVDALIGGINDENLQVRTAAIISLGEFKSQAGIIVPILTKLLADTNLEISVQASQTLKELNPYLK